MVILKSFFEAFLINQWGGLYITKTKTGSCTTMIKPRCSNEAKVLLGMEILLKTFTLDSGLMDVKKVSGLPLLESKSCLGLTRFQLK